MKSILSFGSLYLDINAYHFPIPTDANKLINAETVGKEYEMTLGGSALNVVRFCKTLKMKTYFIGKTGKDLPATTLVSLFKQEKITPFLIQQGDVQTNTNTNVISDTDKSLMLSFGNANQSITAEEIFDEIKGHVQNVDYVYVGGIFKLKNLLSSLIEMTLFLKGHNKKVVLDHGRIINGTTENEKEIVRNLVESIDLYLPSKDEFLELWNVKTIEEGLMLFEKTSLTVVVKDGRNGAYTLNGNNIFHIPAFQVNPINTIGAGDSFNAGLIAALSGGKSLEDAIRYGNATAALKISTNTFPTKEEIEKFLLQQ